MNTLSVVEGYKYGSGVYSWWLRGVWICGLLWQYANLLKNSFYQAITSV